MNTDVHDDIHHGIQETNISEKPIIFSVGHRCTTASLIKEMRLKFESYPFDWVVSKLETVKHCLRTDFGDFLTEDHYEQVESETINLCDGHETFVTTESIVYNTHYEDTMTAHVNKNSDNQRGTYGYMLALTHHDMRDTANKAYFERCIDRLHNILRLPRRKYYLYVNPLIGNAEFDASAATTLLQFIEFAEFMSTVTTNSHGIFFFVVKNEERKHEVVEMFRCDAMTVFVMFANNGMVDAGGVFDGDFYNEQYHMLVSIESIINK